MDYKAKEKGVGKEDKRPANTQQQQPCADKDDLIEITET